MGHDEIVSKTQENTTHIKEVRDAFDSFRDSDFKKFKDNVLFVMSIFGGLLSIGAIIWYLAMFVFKTNTDGANNHNDVIELRKHIDIILKVQSDSINNISHRQLINQVIDKNDFININRRLDTHDFSLRAINNKFDKLQYGGSWVIEHRNKPGDDPTFKQKP